MPTCSSASGCTSFALQLSKVTPAASFVLANALEDLSVRPPAHHHKAILRFLVASGIEMISIAKCEPCTFRDALKAPGCYHQGTRVHSALNKRQRKTAQPSLSFSRLRFSSSFNPWTFGVHTAERRPWYCSDISRPSSAVDYQPPPNFDGSS